MDIVVVNTSDKAIYRQIFEQLSSQIINGIIKSGEPLPSIRTVAKELRISVITVNKAWEELEKEGFIYTMAGKGCFVSDVNAAELSEKREDLARERFIKDSEYYKALGVTKSEMNDMVEKHY